MDETGRPTPEPIPRLNLFVANVHLRPPINRDGSANPLTMRRTSPIRASEVGILLEQLEQARHELLQEDPEQQQLCACLIAGDYNETDQHQACQAVRQAGLADAALGARHRAHALVAAVESLPLAAGPSAAGLRWAWL